MPLYIINLEIKNPFIKEWIVYGQAIENINNLKDEAQVDKTYEDFGAVVRNVTFRAELKQDMKSTNLLTRPASRLLISAMRRLMAKLLS